MRCLLLIMLMAVPWCGGAQKLHFCDTANYWFEHAAGGGTIYDAWQINTTYHLEGDTIVNGNTYSRLSGLYRDWQYPQTNWGGSSKLPFNYLVREDTVAGRIYIIFPPHMNLDTNEVLLYDYTLQVGDTFSLKYSLSFHEFAFIVDQIDSVLINNAGHRRWHMKRVHSVPGTVIWSYDVIEGIGSTLGPWFSGHPYAFENMSMLTCFSNSTVTQSSYPIVKDNYGVCNTLLDIDEIAINSREIVYPLPVTSSTKIVLPVEMQTGKLTIYGSDGRIVFRSAIHNAKDIPVGFLSATPGAFLYIIRDEASGRHYHGTLVVW